jgi:hypothetical protein
MTVRCAAMLLVLALSSGADTLILRNGTQVTGRWWATDAKVISFLVNDHLEFYARPDVSEIVFGAAPSANSAPVPAPATALAPPSSLRSSETIANNEVIVTKPDQIGAIYFQQDSGKLLPLERTEGVPHGASGAAGTGHSGNDQSGQYWDIQGPRSPFRLRSDDKITFVVRMADGIAPNTFSLYPLETKGTTRRTKAAIVSGPVPTIPFTVRKVTGNTYALTPAGFLSPGEYAFSPANSNDAYCFGIDAASGEAR